MIFTDSQEPEKDSYTENAAYEALKPNTDVYVISKDAINRIIDNLTNNFEDLMKKFDKSLAMTNTLSHMNKSVQYSLDKRSENLNLNLKVVLEPALINLFKSEVLSTLITLLETDIKETLNKFSYLLQNRLKIKQERNAIEEEKSKRLNTNIKACVVSFMNLEDQISKTVKKKSKVLNDLDFQSIENVEKLELSNTGASELLYNLKLEVDSLLKNKKYEKAIIRILQENKYELVFSVLNIINPRPLIASGLLSSSCSNKLFAFLLQSIDKNPEFPEIYLWLEELVKSITPTDLKLVLPKIFEASYANPQLSSLARQCSKKIEENYKFEN
jgi:hypothetical protein